MSRRRTVTRRPTYGDAVLWLAANDETSEHDAGVIAGLTTVVLVADLWGAEPARLATDVLRARHGAGRWRLDPESVCRCEQGEGETHG